jgi:hypothetical protein
MAFEMAEKLREGWGWPANSRKAHYFIYGKSSRGEWLFAADALCGRMMFAGALEEGGDGSPDNCAECKRRLKRLQEKRAPK